MDVDSWVKDLLPENTNTFPLYVGVRHDINLITRITLNVMGYFQGETVNRNKTECVLNTTDKNVSVFSNLIV